MDALRARELIFKKMSGKASIHSVIVQEAISLLNEQREMIERLEIAIEDALSVAEMKKEDFLLEPWASLQNAVKKQ